MLRITFMFLTHFFRLPYLLFKLFRMGSKKSTYPADEKYAFLHKAVQSIIRRGRVVSVCEGIENLPKDDSTGYILFPNHQGLFDVLNSIKYFDKPFSVVVKKELEKTFMLNCVLRMLNAEFMDRDDIRQSMKIIQSVSKRVSAGERFIIFPEGTRSRRGNEMLEFKPGAFKAATMAHAPIVPVALVDSFIPLDVKSLKKTTVYMYILEPMYYEEYKDMKTVEIAKIVQDRIAKKIAEHLQEHGSTEK